MVRAPIRLSLTAFALAALCLVTSCLSPSTARVSSLDLSQKAAQVLLIGVEGTGMPSADSMTLLRNLPVGGVVLFGFNLPNPPEQSGAFTAALQEAAARTNVPLVIAIDHEGGSVFRFKGAGITRIPPPSEVGLKPWRFASLLGQAAGVELRDLGFNVALAPVVELLTDDNKRFLGSRSYGREASTVDAAAGAYIRGLQSAGVAAVAKHFPGNASADPHLVLPELDISREVYERDYLPRFASAVRNRVSSVMLSHVVFGAVDPAHPASLSAKVVQGELRKRLGFDGVAITDDLGMKALSSRMSVERSAVEALAAGADMLMLVDMRAAERVRDAIVDAVREGRLSPGRLDEAVSRILELKKRFRMDEALDPIVRAKRLADFGPRVKKDEERIRAYR